jgi:hypothetical protein
MILTRRHGLYCFRGPIRRLHARKFILDALAFDPETDEKYKLEFTALLLDRLCLVTERQRRSST